MLTSHVGSPPRGADLVPLLLARDQGKPYDAVELDPGAARWCGYRLSKVGVRSAGLRTQFLAGPGPEPVSMATKAGSNFSGIAAIRAACRPSAAVLHSP